MRTSKTLCAQRFWSSSTPCRAPSGPSRPRDVATTCPKSSTSRCWTRSLRTNGVRRGRQVPTRNRRLTRRLRALPSRHPQRYPSRRQSRCPNLDRWRFRSRRRNRSRTARHSPVCPPSSDKCVRAGHGPKIDAPLSDNAMTSTQVSKLSLEGGNTGVLRRRGSAEQRRAPVTRRIALPQAWWARENGRAGVGDVFVHRVIAGELRLHRHEVRERIAHERDEEQTGVQVAEAVRPVGEVVTAAQDF